MDISQNVTLSQCDFIFHIFQLSLYILWFNFISHKLNFISHNCDFITHNVTHISQLLIFHKTQLYLQQLTLYLTVWHFSYFKLYLTIMFHYYLPWGRQALVELTIWCLFLTQNDLMTWNIEPELYVHRYCISQPASKLNMLGTWINIRS